MASDNNGTLYTGVTNHLKKRVWQHKCNFIKDFTEKYNIHLLVYYELHESIEQAIIREKKIKRWKRNWKIKLINTMNPSWDDLYDNIC